MTDEKTLDEQASELNAETQQTATDSDRKSVV